jgi:nitrogen fixation protein FixH
MTHHAQPVTGEQPCGFRVTGRLVLLSFIGFFAVVASVNAFMITQAVRTFSGVETENAYKAGLAFNQSIAAAGAQDARGWGVEIARRAPDSADFSVTVRDRAGRPVTGISLEATLQHPNDRRRDQPFAVAALGNGLFQAQTAREPGVWDVVIVLHEGEAELFRSRNRIVVRSSGHE